MTDFPAYCPNCKSIFPFRGFRIEEANVKVTFIDSKTTCPICGNLEAKISDGTYQANSTAIQVLSAPESTLAIIEAFRLLAEQAASGQISKTEAIQKANDLSPKYAALIDQFAKLGLPGLALLVAIIALYLQFEGNKSSSEDSKKILDAITGQTLVLKDKHYEPHIDQKGGGPAYKEPKQKLSAGKRPSGRRSDVNKERRKALKSRRDAFGRTRQH
jgi:hypothetical protein